LKKLGERIRFRGQVLNALYICFGALFRKLNHFMSTEVNSPNTEPPDYLDGARVIKWAWSGQQPFGFVANEDGTEREEIYGLAICRYDKSTSKEPIYRFSCDKYWETVQDSIYDTVENAILHLPEQYRNEEANWLSK
jgi:hypothetical protein